MQNNTISTYPYLVESYGIRAINLFPASLKTKDGTKWGYINNKGNFIIKPRFDYAQDFQQNGLAIVFEKNLSGVINLDGEYVIKPKYETITPFSEGRAIVVTKQGFNVINEKEKILTKKTYSMIGSYEENRALFADTNAKGAYLYGYLDRNGQEVIPLTYLSGDDFQNGRAVVQLEEKEYALIDTFGNIMEKYPYQFIGNYGEGLLVFQQDKDGLYGYLNEKGKIIIPTKYKGAGEFQDGVAIVNEIEDNLYKYGLIDKKGKVILKPKYSDINLLGENRVAVGLAIDKDKPYYGFHYAIGNERGQFLTDYIYNHVSPFEKGYASTSDDKETFFITKSGHKANHLPIVKGSGSIFFEGQIYKAVVNMRTFYLDKTGQIIWKQNTVIPLNKQYRVIEQRYTPNKDYILYYPQLQGMAENEKVVNEKLEKISKVEAKHDTSYNGDFSIEFFKKNLLVLELTGYEFPFGAAHGMPTKEYPHIDLVSGQFYKLKDLFKPNSDYVKVLSDIIGEQIKNNEKYSYVFPDSYKGIEPDQPFYVSENELMIYFTPYEIAPYVAGFPTFKIPYHEINNIIEKHGHFWQAFH